MAGDWNVSFSEKPKGNEGANPEVSETRSPFELPPMPIKIARAGDDDKRKPFTVPEDPNPRTPPVDPLATGQWRATPTVAPIARNLPPTDGKQPTPPTGQTRRPFEVPANDPPIPPGQWRGTPEVAPPARNLPPTDGKPPKTNPNPNPNDNGGVVTPGDPGQWQPAREQVPGRDGRAPSDGPGGAVSNDPSPTTGNDGIVMLSNQKRDNINQSLNTQLNYFTHFAEAAIGGLAGSSLIPYYGDKLAWKASLDGNKLANYWRENHSPLGLELKTQSVQRQEIIQKGIDLEPKVVAAKAARTTAMAEFMGKPAAGGAPATGFHEMQKMHLDTVVARDASLVAGTPDNPIFAKKAQLLEDMMKSRPTTPEEFAYQRQRIDTHKMPAGLKAPTELSFLTPAEAHLLDQQVVKYGKVVGLDNALADAKNQFKATQAELLAVEEGMAALRAKGGNFNKWGTTKPWVDRVRPGASALETELTTWHGTNKWRAAGEGIGIVATGLAVNYAVDKFMPDIMGIVGGQDSHLFSKQQYYLEGPAIAAALILPSKSLPKRLCTVALAVGAAEVWNHVAPGPPNATYSRLMQPNWGDAAGMSAAWMLPFGSWKGRAVAVGGAWLGARGLNALDSVIDVPGIEDHHFAQGMNRDVQKALEAGKLTESGFKDVVSKSHTLAMENEGALLMQMSDFMNAKNHDPLFHLYGSSALYTAYGDLSMSRGTKLDPNTTNDKGRILAGENFDLGGQATEYYRQALTNLVEGQNNANLNKRPSESQAMAESQKMVVERLEKIYGAHNIGNVHDKIKEAYKLDVDAVNHFQVSLKEQVDRLQTKDKAYAAKMCRDLAIVNLAIASFKVDNNEGGGASIMYQEALEYLANAERIKGDNPDLPQLRRIADSLKGRVPQAVRAQEDNKFNAPFGQK